MARAMKTPLSRRGPAHRGANTAPLRGNSAWTIRRVRGLQIVESRALAKLDWLLHGFSTRPGRESSLGGEPALNLGFTDLDERANVGANPSKFAAALPPKTTPLVELHPNHPHRSHS